MKTVAETKEETRELFYRGAFTADIQNRATMNVVGELLHTIRNVLENIPPEERAASMYIIPNLYQTISVLLFIPDTEWRGLLKEILSLARSLVNQPQKSCNNNVKPYPAVSVVSDVCDIIMTMFVEPGEVHEADSEPDSAAPVTAEEQPVPQCDASSDNNSATPAEEYSPEWSAPEEKSSAPQYEAPPQQSLEPAAPLPEWATSTDQ